MRRRHAIVRFLTRCTVSMGSNKKYRRRRDSKVLDSWWVIYRTFGRTLGNKFRFCQRGCGAPWNQPQAGINLRAAIVIPSRMTNACPYKKGDEAPRRRGGESEWLDRSEPRSIELKYTNKLDNGTVVDRRRNLAWGRSNGNRLVFFRKWKNKNGKILIL